MSDTRAMNTKQLLAAIREGISLGLNRQLEYAAIKRAVDYEGWHVFTVILPFHEAFDRSLPPHHRVNGLIKLWAVKEGLEVTFDVTSAHWNRCLKAEMLLRSLEEADVEYNKHLSNK